MLGKTVTSLTLFPKQSKAKQTKAKNKAKKTNQNKPKQITEHLNWELNKRS